MSKKIELDNETISKILQLYNTGASILHIKAKLDLSHKVIIRILDDNNIKRRTHGEQLRKKVDDGYLCCSVCKKKQPVCEFYTRGAYVDGTPTYRNACKQCDRTSSKVRIRGALKRQYNLTLEEYDSMFIDQNGLCAICEKPESSKTVDGHIKLLCVDHDHNTGKVRQLLCNKCNRALGMLQDDITIASNAVNYLKKHSGLV
jgi:hypothetical protein